MNQNVKIVLPYAVLMGLVYLSASLLGFAAGVATPTLAQQQVETFNEVQGDFTRAQTLLVQVFVIFIVNAVIGLMLLTIGHVIAQLSGLWIGAPLLTVVQGFKTGVILAHVVNVTGCSPALLCVLLLPHGILELPAMFVSAGIGLMLGYHISMKRCEEPNYWGNDIVKKWQNIFYVIVVPIYFVAAIIEVYITPIIMYLVVGV